MAVFDLVSVQKGKLIQQCLSKSVNSLAQHSYYVFINKMVSVLSSSSLGLKGSLTTEVVALSLIDLPLSIYLPVSLGVLVQ